MYSITRYLRKVTNPQSMKVSLRISFLFKQLLQVMVWKWENKFNWENSLSKIDTNHGADGHISPSERSGNISHWLMMKRQAESDERFLIMEHDSYLLDIDRFRRSMMFMTRHDMCYANLGLFMSCYSYIPKAFAYWQWDLLVEKNFPINCRHTESQNVCTKHTQIII